MPTNRPRITITETPEVARRLNMAAALMPERAGSRRELLLALTELAEQALSEPSGGVGDEREKAKELILSHTADLSPARAEAMLEARDADWRHELY